MANVEHESGALISEAAALYGIQPSTLRWWERQGVVDEPPRVGGYRRYSNRDLRQIGMAYLCCVVGKMPLERAAVVSSRETNAQIWRRTVTEQIDLLERHINDLRTARDFLSHLLRCEAEVVGDCHHLDGAPPGRDWTDGPDLVAAAQKAVRPLPQETGRRRNDSRDDERRDDHDAEARGAESACLSCGEPIPPSAGRGRPRKYCSRTCRQRSYRGRQVSDPSDR